MKSHCWNSGCATFSTFLPIPLKVFNMNTKPPNSAKNNRKLLLGRKHQLMVLLWVHGLLQQRPTARNCSECLQQFTKASHTVAQPRWCKVERSFLFICIQVPCTKKEMLGFACFWLTLQFCGYQMQSEKLLGSLNKKFL